jgi:hypothetical protein
MSVVVVRSRPHNAGERPRRASPSGIVRQPEPGGKHIRAMSRGALGGTEGGSGGRTRTPGGLREPPGAGEVGVRPWCSGGGLTGGRGPQCWAAAAPMRRAWGGHPVAVGRVGVPGVPTGRPASGSSRAAPREGSAPGRRHGRGPNPPATA